MVLPVQAFPPFSSARTNRLKSLFTYSRLDKLGYVFRKSCPVSDLKSWQSSGAAGGLRDTSVSFPHLFSSKNMSFLH